MKQYLYIYNWLEVTTSLFLLLLIFFPFFYSGIFIEDQVILLSIIVFCPLVLLQTILKKGEMSLSVLDLVLVVFVTYLIGRLFVSHEYQVFNLLKIVSLICWYLLFRLLVSSRIIIWTIISAGILQTILAILQSQFIVTGNHSFFNITGTFHNPAPFAGFLAFSFVFFFSICLKYLWQKDGKWIYFIPCTIFLVYGLYLSDSRASWLAIIISISIMILKNIWLKLNNKYLILSILIIIVVFLSIILYYYKPNSADGRLFIWERSLEMIKDKPLFGHGIEGFRRNYMVYQANYFAENPQSIYAKLADNVEYAYNEFIKTTVEIGFVGLSLFLILLFLRFVTIKQTSENRITHDGLITLLVFSLFSYPSDVYLFLILFCFSFASPPEKSLSFKLNRQLLVCSFCISLLISIWGANKMYDYYKIDMYVKKYVESESPSIIRSFYEKHSSLKNHRPFMAWFARQTFQQQDWDYALPILKDASNNYPCLEIYSDLGTIHQQVGDHTTAEHYYKMASFMVPFRLYPKYKLFKLYLHEKDSIKTKKIVEEILSIPVKIENTQSLRIKAEVSNYR